MKSSVSLCAASLTLASLGWLAGAIPTCADDLTTLAGTTYRQVRVVRVEPDGIIWEHAAGMCKVDFTDLPEPMRRTYGCDAKRAAAYQTAQTEALRQAAERRQQAQRETAAWQTKHFQEQAPLSGANAVPGSFAARRNATDLSAERFVGAQMAAKKSERDILTRDDSTLWDRRLWAVPCLLTGGYSPGLAFDPRTDLNPREYQASLHGGGTTLNSLQDSFFTPVYQTKSYDDDVERAKAFARGRP